MKPTQNQGGARAPSQNTNADDATTGQEEIVVPASEGRKAAPELSAREKLIAGLDEKIVAGREADDATFLASGDPRAAMIAAEMKRMREEDQTDLNPEEQAAADRAQEPLADLHDDMAASAAAEQEGAQQAKPVRAQAVADPLAEYTVIQNGKPMFRTKVDGKEHLIPLETARTQLQKHLAADIRLQSAAETQKQLDARAKQIQQTEANLKAREAKLNQSQPSAAAADDLALEREAADLVRSLTSEPEAQVATKLVAVLKKVRQAPSAPPVDLNAVAQAAANTAVQAIRAEAQEKDLQAGLTAFTQEYPELASDVDLYNMADRKTDTIAQEHPEWSPSQVMREAGKQTRDWLTTLRGGKPAGAPTNDRLARKQNLRPMPPARSARVTTAQPLESEDTPQSAIADIRKGRGQPY